jgi:site-specific DNA-methyltransferase (adenine-specific)
MGAGGVGIACKNTGRNFIGIEIDEKYFNIAKERLLK